MSLTHSLRFDVLHRMSVATVRWSRECRTYRLEFDDLYGPPENGPQPKGHSMRISASALSLILLASIPAFAGQTEGRIKSVDEEKLTITLEDGKSYKLPGEVDLGGIEPGTEIVINFDTVGDVNQITDMAVYE
jgi:hypothetical protein